MLSILSAKNETSLSSLQKAHFNIFRLGSLISIFLFLSISRVNSGSLFLKDVLYSCLHLLHRIYSFLNANTCSIVKGPHFLQIFTISAFMKHYHLLDYGLDDSIAKTAEQQKTREVWHDYFS